MAITDIRKALTESTPFYAAAGTVDLAAEKLREVQPILDRLREEAPERIEKIRSTDAKLVQDRMSRQAKDVQVRLTEVIGTVELDLKKLRDNAQDFAMQQIGRAAEYAVKAGETYNGLADRGRGAVRTWRGEAADATQDLAVTIEPEPAVPPAAQRKPHNGQSATNGHSATNGQSATNGSAANGSAAKQGGGKSGASRKSPQGK